MSTLEFIGCVVAVVGGAWLGALYLGVDVPHLAHTALSEAQLLDKMPPALRPADPKQQGASRSEMAEALRTELDSLRREITTLRQADDNGAVAQPDSGESELAKGQTHVYWLRLSEIALGEAALQRDAETALNQANAAQVFAVKARISRFAASAVRAVSHDGVDRSVAQFGHQLAAWYDRGGELYDRAVGITESPSAGAAREKINRQWHAAERQHRNEARLLSERAVVVRGAVSRRYGEEFPEFARPNPRQMPELPQEQPVPEL